MTEVYMKKFTKDNVDAWITSIVTNLTPTGLRPGVSTSEFVDKVRSFMHNMIDKMDDFYPGMKEKLVIITPQDVPTNSIARLSDSLNVAYLPELEPTEQLTVGTASRRRRRRRAQQKSSTIKYKFPFKTGFVFSVYPKNFDDYENFDPFFFVIFLNKGEPSYALTPLVPPIHQWTYSMEYLSRNMTGINVGYNDFLMDYMGIGTSPQIKAMINEQKIKGQKVGFTPMINKFLEEFALFAGPTEYKAIKAAEREKKRQERSARSRALSNEDRQLLTQANRLEMSLDEYKQRLAEIELLSGAEKKQAKLDLSILAIRNDLKKLEPARLLQSVKSEDEVLDDMYAYFDNQLYLEWLDEAERKLAEYERRGMTEKALELEEIIDNDSYQASPITIYKAVEERLRELRTRLRNPRASNASKVLMVGLAAYGLTRLKKKK